MNCNRNKIKHEVIRLSAPSIQIKLSIKNDAPAIFTQLNRRTEFYLVVQNFDARYLPQVRVTLTAPPEIRLLKGREWYGGIVSGRKKSRLFKIIPKAEGLFTLTAFLQSKKNQILTLPIEVRVGNVPMQSAPVTRQIEPSIKKLVGQINCEYCGEKIEEDAKFCPICGSSLTKKIKIVEEKTTRDCPNCNQELPLDAKFCAKCGEKL